MRSREVLALRLEDLLTSTASMPSMAETRHSNRSAVVIGLRLRSFSTLPPLPPRWRQSSAPLR
jgi:hypothetical protein